MEYGQAAVGPHRTPNLMTVNRALLTTQRRSSAFTPKSTAHPNSTWAVDRPGLGLLDKGGWEPRDRLGLPLRIQLQRGRGKVGYMSYERPFPSSEPSPPMNSHALRSSGPQTRPVKLAAGPKQTVIAAYLVALARCYLQHAIYFLRSFASCITGLFGQCRSLINGQ